MKRKESKGFQKVFGNAQERNVIKNLHQMHIIYNDNSNTGRESDC